MSLFFLDHGILKKTLQCDSVTHSGHVSTIFGDSVSLPRKRDISDRLAFDRTVERESETSMNLPCPQSVNVLQMQDLGG